MKRKELIWETQISGLDKHVTSIVVSKLCKFGQSSDLSVITVSMEEHINLFEKVPKNVFCHFFFWFSSSQKYKNLSGFFKQSFFKIGHENMPKSRVRLKLVICSHVLVMQFIMYFQTKRFDKSFQKIYFLKNIVYQMLRKMFFLFIC